MKNIFTALIFFGSLHAVSAQFTKGTVLLGGTVGITNISVEGEGITVFNLSPTAGFFTGPRFALGASLGCNLLAGSGETIIELGFSPFARYYFKNAGKARFFGQPSVGILYKGDEGQYDYASLSFGVGFGAD